MSMPVAYVPPDYEPPERAEAAWRGPERRSRDPVDRLGRSLNRLCLEATDRFEIVAHLEALGLNSPTALRRLGVDDHFDLAAALFQRTPKTLAPRRPAPRAPRDRAAPLAMALAFAVTFALGALAGPDGLAPALWVLVWSQGAAALLSRAEGELPREARPAVVAFLLQAGFAGLVGAWAVTGFALDAGAPALLWFGVAGTLWAGRKRLAVALPLVAGATAAAAAWAGAAPELGQALVVLAALAPVLPATARDPQPVLAWARSRAAALPGPLAYGVGQALLILALLRDGPAGAEALHGAVLLAVLLLASGALLAALRERLARRLWRDTAGGAFAAAARLALLAYAAAYATPLAAAGVVGWLAGPQPWFFHWYAFALLGLCMALAVASFMLGDPLAPGGAFLLAGGAALGASFLVACVVLAAALLARLLARAGRVERYAVHLL